MNNLESYREKLRRKRALKKRNRMLLLIVLLSFLSFFVSFVLVGYWNSNQLEMKKCHDVALSVRHIKMIDYFKTRGNKHPEAMATAVLQTQKPRIMAAIAVRGEKNTPYTVKKGGFKKKHVGAWQLNEKYWGKAGNIPLDQALKAEKVLDDLTIEVGSLEDALNFYGGDKTKKVYASNVLSELENIP